MNLPNKLTILRMIMIIPFVVFMLVPIGGGAAKWIALALFVVASLTDLLDGRIARKYNLITDFGKLVDPFADKVMVLTALLSMAIGSSAIPPVVPWVAVIILLMKELVMIIGGLVMLKHGIVVYSRLIGKTAHCVFIAGLVATYFHDWFVARCVGWMLTPDLLLLWLGVCITLCALVFYVSDAIRKAKEKGII